MVDGARKPAYSPPAVSCNRSSLRAAMLSVPVIVSPALSTLSEAAPVNEPAKAPLPLRATIVSAVLVLVASVAKVISLVPLVIVRCGSLVANVFRLMVLAVLSLKIMPAPEPTFAAVVCPGSENWAKEIGSVSIIANGVSQTHPEPALTVPDKMRTYAVPAVSPLAKSDGRVHAPECATHNPFSTGSV